MESLAKSAGRAVAKGVRRLYQEDTPSRDTTVTAKYSQ